MGLDQLIHKLGRRPSLPERVEVEAGGIRLLQAERDALLRGLIGARFRDAAALAGRGAMGSG